MGKKRDATVIPEREGLPGANGLAAVVVWIPIATVCSGNGSQAMVPVKKLSHKAYLGVGN